MTSYWTFTLVAIKENWNHQWEKIGYIRTGCFWQSVHIATWTIYILRDTFPKLAIDSRQIDWDIEDDNIVFERHRRPQPFKGDCFYCHWKFYECFSIRSLFSWNALLYLRIRVSWNKFRYVRQQTLLIKLRENMLRSTPASEIKLFNIKRREDFDTKRFTPLILHRVLVSLLTTLFGFNYLLPLMS